MQPGNPDRYVLSRSQEERQRLVLQDELLGSMTRSLFQRAGLREGSRVLDVGSGVGGVALLACDIVGTSGSVVGVEIDAESAAVAVQRCAVAGVSKVTFLVDDVATATLPGPFDAVVGRLVLMHLRDPIAILARLRAMLRPNGIVAFLEGIMAAPRLSQPRSQSLEELERVRLRAVGRVPANLLMGLDLRRVFLHAGLGEPHLSAEALIGGGPGWPGFNLIEETLRSLAETWSRAGVEGADQIVVDGLAERIEREVGDEGTVLMQPHVGAWARVGG